MIVTFLRSSSYNNWDFCQMQYYMTYVLGIRQSSGQKAVKGTIVHKVLECLAILKKAHEQDPDNPIINATDDAIGAMSVSVDDFLRLYELKDDEVTKINKTRVNKSNYKHECHLHFGCVRHGVSLVEELIERAYKYYTEKESFNWKPVDFKDCSNWTWMALEYLNGEFDPRMRKITCPEQAFDISIDKPWSQYCFKNPDGTFTEGNLHIKGTIDLITQIDENTLEIVDWKGLPVETPIPTIDGWKTMGDLTKDDIIFDKDGQQTRILEKSSKSYKPCYEINFDDTTTAICDNEHLWYLDDTRVVDAPNLKIGDRIDVAKPIDYNYVDLPIDPYVLGMWLGDGRNRSAEITSGDDFIFEEIACRGYTVGKNIAESSENVETKTIINTTNKLRSLNLLHNKHIPEIYLRSAYYQRLDLLRGLMDSDGNVNETRKQAVFTSCNKNLSDDVKELLISLGQRPNQSHINRDTNFKDDVDVYPIAFRPININPFLLPRKANRIDPNWGPGKSNKRTITKITAIPERETQCIMVDSPTSTYLCTKNMIPTHNTGQRIDWASKNGDTKTYAKLCRDPQLLLYYYAAKHLFPDKNIILTIFFIRDGGPFSMCFEEHHFKKAEDMLEARFNEIQACTTPTMQDPTQTNFKCTRICDYYKMQKGGTNFCKHVHGQIQELGFEEATRLNMNESFDVNEYEAPG